MKDDAIMGSDTIPLPFCINHILINDQLYCAVYIPHGSSIHSPCGFTTSHHANYACKHYRKPEKSTESRLKDLEIRIKCIEDYLTFNGANIS